MFCVDCCVSVFEKKKSCSLSIIIFSALYIYISTNLVLLCIINICKTYIYIHGNEMRKKKKKRNFTELYVFCSTPNS